MVNSIVDVRMFFGVISDWVVEIMRNKDDDLWVFCDDLLFVDLLVMVVVVGFLLL